jgi:serine phosphatase RsbU (regulator of sigma subunit)
MRKQGRPESIRSVVPPLGLAEQPQFVETNIELNAGDGFVLYTDGFFGPAGENGTRLTPARLAETLDPSALTAEGVLANMLKAAMPGNGVDGSPDDMAAVVVRRMV